MPLCSGFHYDCWSNEACLWTFNSYDRNSSMSKSLYIKLSFYNIKETPHYTFKGLGWYLWRYSSLQYRLTQHALELERWGSKWVSEAGWQVFVWGTESLELWIREGKKWGCWAQKSTQLSSKLGRSLAWLQEIRKPSRIETRKTEGCRWDRTYPPWLTRQDLSLWTVFLWGCRQLPRTKEQKSFILYSVIAKWFPSLQFLP